MKERQILFNGPMVRAVLAGTKTQTRRVAPITDLHIDQHSDNTVTWGVRFSKPIKGVLGSHSGGRLSKDQARSIIASQFCPHGQPGDRLWVRESGWERTERTPKMMREGADTWPRFAYAADGWNDQDRADFKAWGFKPRPSIHMPRWASRITLEIVGVSVERLQEISEADAMAEGINCYPFRPDDGFPVCDGFTYRENDGKCGLWPKAAQAYRELWESINGPGSWDANPFVWVVEFKKTTKGK